MPGALHSKPIYGICRPGRNLFFVRFGGAPLAREALQDALEPPPPDPPFPLHRKPKALRKHPSRTGGAPGCSRDTHLNGRRLRALRGHLARMGGGGGGQGVLEAFLSHGKRHKALRGHPCRTGGASRRPRGTTVAQEAPTRALEALLSHGRCLQALQRHPSRTEGLEGALGAVLSHGRRLKAPQRHRCRKGGAHRRSGGTPLA